MNREKFREIHDVLMKQLDVSRELSDEEILEVIDNLILNQARQKSHRIPGRRQLLLDRR